MIMPASIMLRRFTKPQNITCVKPQKPNETKRLQSLDTLRGFDMFWIMGGESIFVALGALTGWPVLKWWATQMEHMPWHGFAFYDMIFPLFLFIAGISFPFSLAKNYEGKDKRKALYWHIFKRAFTLVVLGIIVNNGVNFNFANMRYGSVLGHIGLAWMFAALIFINAGPKFRIVWISGILLVYWFLLMFFPAHDLGATDPYSMEGSLTGWIDRILMPGKLYLKIHDPEGILSTLPAIGTAMLGMFTGQFVKSDYLKNKLNLKALFMILAGVALIIIGKIWGLTFPINKNLWTSSYVCFVGGISLMLFSVFYLVIDVWNFKKWTLFFSVIGVNSITIYLGMVLFDFSHTSRFLFGGLTGLFPENWTALIGAIGYFAIGWIILYFFYKRKIFLKV
jgi:predicted acyltransferase